MILLALEIMTWTVNGNHSAPALFLNPTHNILAFIVNPFPAFLWALYTHHQVVQDGSRLQELLVPFSLPLILFSLLVLSNPATEALFFIDEYNLYHRGPYFLLLVAVDVFYFAYSYAIILKNRKFINKRIFYPLLLFPLPLIVGGVIQLFFYGLTLMWSGLTLSLLFVYNSIQTEKLNTDFLTGVNNRMGFEQYYRSKLNDAHGCPFGGIILDIDNFKQINDRFGHAAGDNALQITAGLVRKCLRKEDYIARYGGDEFIVLVNTKYRPTLEIIANRITNSVRAYNLTSSEPYELDFSIGYDIFDKSQMDEDTFIKHIDTLMYNNKKAKVPIELDEQDQ